MITVIGSVNMDLIASVQRLPKPGETVLGTHLLRAPGGKGANQAVAAARAGSEVAFVGRVGDDADGSDLLRELRTAGVQTDQVSIDDARPTGLALITVNAQGENAIVVAPGANRDVSAVDVDRARDMLAASRYVVLQLEIPLETVRYVTEIAPSLGTQVILNAAPAQPLDPDLLGKTGILVANQHEIATLAGRGAPIDPEDAAHMLLETGLGTVVLTLGADGVVIARPNEPDIEIPAFPVEVRDTTGAGDTFVGNLAHGLDSGQSLPEAARFANAAAAISVQRAGAQPSMPMRAETEVLLHRESA